MKEISRTQYMDEIQSLANHIVCEAMDDCQGDRAAAEESIGDHVLHEAIDGHRWVIYTAYNMDVMRNSDNMDYYVDNFGGNDAGQILKKDGLNGLHSVIAYWCMYADVENQLPGEFDDYEEAHELKA